MNRTKPEKRARIIHQAAEGASARSISRTHKASINAVYNVLRDAGDAAIDFDEVQLRDLKPNLIEIDEVHTWVRLKQKTCLRRGFAPEGAGVFWIWIALDAESKLVIAWHVGTRGLPDAITTTMKVKKRLEKSVRPQITTDRYPGYPRAIEKAFGKNANYAVVKLSDDSDDDQDLAKQKAERRRRRWAKLSEEDKTRLREKAKPSQVTGKPDLDKATTAHIERFNLTLRQHLRRLHRRTTGWSKDVDNLRRAIALFIFYYNFCREHRSLGVTPAQAAGVTNERWTAERFLNVVEAYLEKRRQLGYHKDEQQPTQALDRALDYYVVYHNKKQNYAKVHRPECKDAQNALGNGGEKHKPAFYPAVSLEAAFEVAKQLASDDYSVCSKCMGRYHTLGYKKL